MERTQHEVRTAEGHLLLVEVAGPEQGDVVIFHHGTPGSRFRDEEMIDIGADKGLRHVSYSRPGYEGSDRQAGRRVVDCAHDVRAIVDQLGLESGFVVGESGGGPHALAQAASLSGWTLGVAVTVGPAPFEAEGLSWLDGMAPGNREEFEAMMISDAAGQAFLEARIEKLKAARDLRQITEALGDLYTDEDLRSLEKEGVEEYVLDTWSRAATSGLWGWFDDGKAILGDWGFDLDQVKAPVAVWHGEDDRAVPVAHGRWVADHLPNAIFHPLRGEGHSSFFDHYAKVLDDLMHPGT
jgi:pimeloyl-ACP methyl ester carboxylesterase